MPKLFVSRSSIMEMKCSKYKSYKSGLIKLQLIEFELKSDVFNFSKLSTIFIKFILQIYTLSNLSERKKSNQTRCNCSCLYDTVKLVDI